MTALSDLRSIGLSVLTCERAEPEGYRCSECGERDSRTPLFKYATQIGRRMREHDGLFCSKDCHDRFHGLRRRA